MIFTGFWLKAKAKMKSLGQQPVVLAVDIHVASLNTIKATPQELWCAYLMGRTIKTVAGNRRVMMKRHRGNLYLWSTKEL